MLCNDILAAC